MQSFPGEMVHTELRRASLAEFPKSGLHVAAINYAALAQKLESGASVASICTVSSTESISHAGSRRDRSGVFCGLAVFGCSDVLAGSKLP